MAVWPAAAVGGVRGGRAAPVGWCSWYELGTSVSEGAMVRNTDDILKVRAAVALQMQYSLWAIPTAAVSSNTDDDLQLQSLWTTPMGNPCRSCKLTHTGGVLKAAQGPRGRVHPARRRVPAVHRGLVRATPQHELPSRPMALITSDCGTQRSPGSTRPQSPQAAGC